MSRRRDLKRLGSMTVIVILLTPLVSCSLFKSEVNFYENDPIAQAALGTKASSSKEEQLQVEEQLLHHKKEIQNAINSGDLVVGMGMKDVRAIWGQPREIETAGNPNFGNQKWIYSESLFTQWNLKASRIVYFERGQVIGWENNR